MLRRAATLVSMVAGTLMCATPHASPADASQVVARLDADFQAAVKRNDVDTMARILHPNMLLILGDGRVNTREEQLQEARDKVITYEIQDEEPGTQTVRVYGNTAIVTACLRIKGTSHGVAFDRRLWFSDIYVRTGKGWRYVFGQASLHLPEPQPVD